MGQDSILTKSQIQVLDKISQNTYIRDNFYFTGGTVLSEFYLHHRYSEDLDFFTEKPYNHSEVTSVISSICKSYHWEYTAEVIDSLYMFHLQVDTNTVLKVDFSHYPFNRIEKSSIVYKEMKVDSFLDIAINKLTTIQQRAQIKDFVDCYYIFEKESIWDLIEGARIKFRLKIDPWVLSTDLLKCQDFTSLPRMIKPISLDQLKAYYRNLAQDMGRRSTEE